LLRKRCGCHREAAMLFGLGSLVNGASGKLGEVERIMFDPNTRRAEYLVVRHDALMGGLRVVPFHEITRVDEHGLHLGMDDDGFKALSVYHEDVDRARDPDYIAPPSAQDYGRSGAAFQMDAITARGTVGYDTDNPLGYPGFEQREADDRQLPAVGRGTAVFDAAGEKVGDVSDLSVESETGMAARIVVRQGLIFKSDFDIPIDWVDGWTPRGVGLNVSKDEIEARAA
jgi:sporulation protein YlmC with PRC-barrel domain